jgi:FkbM family methyltransferase
MEFVNKIMKTTYAQNKEDLFVLEYFKGFKGSLLEIGANDGVTFSNSRLLIENGWSAHLVEPASVFHDLKRLYADNPEVHCYSTAIGDKHGIITLYESEAHVPGGSDRALVSSLSQAETERWTVCGVKFEQIPVNVIPFNYFWELTDFAKFHFISVDIEGLDWLVLQQINLSGVDCKCLIIEHNSNEGLKTDFCRYCCDQFGMKVALVNAENIIFIKS